MRCSATALDTRRSLREFRLVSPLTVTLSLESLTQATIRSHEPDLTGRDPSPNHSEFPQSTPLHRRNVCRTYLWRVTTASPRTAAARRGRMHGGQHALPPVPRPTVCGAHIKHCASHGTDCHHAPLHGAPTQQYIKAVVQLLVPHCHARGVLRRSCRPRAQRLLRVEAGHLGPERRAPDRTSMGHAAPHADAAHRAANIPAASAAASSNGQYRRLQRPARLLQPLPSFKPFEHADPPG